MQSEKANRPRGVMLGCDASEVVVVVCVAECEAAEAVLECEVVLVCACAADSAVPVAYVRT